MAYWTVDLPYSSDEVEEIKLEWETRGAVYGHVLGRAKAVPIYVPTAVYADGRAVRLTKIVVRLADAERHVYNYIVLNGKPFYLVPDRKGYGNGEIVGTIKVFLRGKKSPERIPVFHLQIEARGRRLVKNYNNLQVIKKTLNIQGVGYHPPIYIPIFDPARGALVCLAREVKIQPQRVPEGVFICARGFVIHDGGPVQLRVMGVRRLVSVQKGMAGREVKFGNHILRVERLQEGEREKLDRKENKHREAYQLVWYSERPLNHAIIPLTQKYYVRVVDDPTHYIRYWVFWAPRGLRCVVVNNHHRDCGMDRVYVRVLPTEKLVFVHRDPNVA